MRVAGRDLVEHTDRQPGAPGQMLIEITERKPCSGLPSILGRVLSCMSPQRALAFEQGGTQAGDLLLLLRHGFGGNAPGWGNSRRRACRRGLCRKLQGHDGHSLRLYAFLPDGR